MANPTETRIYRLGALCGALSASAVIIPRFMPNREGRIASAATAVLVFLALLMAAAVLALYLLVVTVRAYRDIPLPPRLAGIAPGVVLVTVFVMLILFLRF